jgi:replicative DNA helicase
MLFGKRRHRVPPHDLEAETSVLGALLLDPKAVSRVLAVLTPDDFYRENNGVIYQAALALFREGKPIDNVTLATELARVGVLERVGGHAQLALLQESVPTAANVGHYAGIVRDRAFSRREISGLAPFRLRRHTGETRMLDGLARLLPAAERVRFVAEEQGNLGDCTRWESVKHLVGLVIGVLGLAWMMRRDGRRRRP